MTNIRCAPKRRFLGYKNEWVQRKLGDLVDRVTRKNTNLESNLPLTISAQYGLIDQNEFFDKRIASKDVSGYYLLYNGEFAYNKSTSNDAPWGAIKRLDRYDKGVLSTLYVLFSIKNQEKTDSDYLTTYYDNTQWHKEIHAIAAEGARNHGLLNIAPADFFATKVILPKFIDEQRKIGLYFKQLDKLINLHQRRIVKLNCLKKAYLSEMFPAPGERKPRRRFAGFTGDWECLNLGMIATFRGGGTPSKSNAEYWNGDIIWLSSQEINKGGFVDKGTYTITQKAVDDGVTKMVKAGTPLFISRSGILEHHFPITRPTTDVAINQDIKALIFDENRYSVEFVVYMMEQKSSYILKSIVKGGTTVQSVNMPDLENMEIFIPKIDEQKKIGHYFSNLDNFITLHQCRLAKLQALKKAYLTEMFV